MITSILSKFVGGALKGTKKKKDKKIGGGYTRKKDAGYSFGGMNASGSSAIVVRPTSSITKFKPQSTPIVNYTPVSNQTLESVLSSLLQSTSDLNQYAKTKYNNDLTRNKEVKANADRLSQIAKEEKVESKKERKEKKNDLGLKRPQLKLLDWLTDTLKRGVFIFALVELSTFFTNPERRKMLFGFIEDTVARITLKTFDRFSFFFVSSLFSKGGLLNFILKALTTLTKVVLKITTNLAKLALKGAAAGVKGLFGLGKKPPKPKVPKPVGFGRGLLGGARRLVRPLDILFGWMSFTERKDAGQTNVQAGAGAGGELAGGTAAAALAAKVGSPLLLGGPLGWLGYAVLVGGAGVGGAFFGGKVADRFTGVGQTPAGQTPAGQTPEQIQSMVSPTTRMIEGVTLGERAGYSQSRGRDHRGRDIAAPSGTPLKVITDSTITDKGFENAYGNYVVFKDANGLEHMYGHMMEPSSYSKGDQVPAGTVIGKVGSTGRSSGPHLHWEVSPNIGEVGYGRTKLYDPIDDYNFSMYSPFSGDMMTTQTNTSASAISRQASYDQDSVVVMPIVQQSQNAPGAGASRRQSTVSGSAVNSKMELNRYYTNVVLSSLYRQ